MRWLAVILAPVSAIAVSVGVGWIYPPAGVITAGIEGLAASYVVAYLWGRS